MLRSVFSYPVVLKLSLAEAFHFYPSSTRALRWPSASNVLLYADTYF
jgi:hypothetical protein